jgi:hypothetical protein
VTATTPTAPFTDVATLEEFFRTRLYGPDVSVQFASAFAFYGVGSMEELMAMPACMNSGSLSSFGVAWFGIFPFVDMNTQSVQVDDVLVGDQGYAVLFRGRWSGRCNAAFKLPSGESIDLAGKSFAGLRYAYKLSFSRETKKAILFEGLFDVAEWGRLMGSKEFALAAARYSLYPA